MNFPGSFKFHIQSKETIKSSSRSEEGKVEVSANSQAITFPEYLHGCLDHPISLDEIPPIPHHKI